MQVIAFIMLLTETGLRISDAATFNVHEHVNDETHECLLFMHGDAWRERLAKIFVEASPANTGSDRSAEGLHARRKALDLAHHENVCEGANQGQPGDISEA